jgi:Na+/proline symporter
MAVLIILSAVVAYFVIGVLVARWDVRDDIKHNHKSSIGNSMLDMFFWFIVIFYLLTQFALDHNEIPRRWSKQLFGIED